MKHTTQYLYGIKPEEFIEMPYIEALEFKREQAKRLFSALIIDGADEDRRHYVWKALEHTDALLQEIHEN